MPRELDRHGAIERGIAGEIHVAHPAALDEALDRVACRWPQAMMAATETLRAPRVRRVGLRQRVRILQEGRDADREGDTVRFAARRRYMGGGGIHRAPPAQFRGAQPVDPQSLEGVSYVRRSLGSHAVVGSAVLRGHARRRGGSGAARGPRGRCHRGIHHQPHAARHDGRARAALPRRRNPCALGPADERRGSARSCCPSSARRPVASASPPTR